MATTMEGRAVWYPPRMRCTGGYSPTLLSLIIAVFLLSPGLTGCSGLASAADRRTQVAEWKSATKDELKGAFDQVARNLGLVEAAYYTYTLEFREVPASPEVLLDSGHLPPGLTNPYTGAPLGFGDMEPIGDAIRSGAIEAGDIWFRPDPGGGELGIAGLFLNPNEPANVKWMRRDITRYYDPATWMVIFGDTPGAEDRLVRIRMEHLKSAIEEYEIRFGDVPPDFEALRQGDMWVDYPNPFAPERLMAPSEEYHPGDFFYKRREASDYQLIGWGATGATWFYASTPEDWGVQMVADGPGWQLVKKTQAELAQLQAAGPEAFEMPTEYQVNQRVATEYITWQLEVQRVADWAATHPDCASCGSTFVFWAEKDGRPVCVDERSGVILPDCCCAELEMETPTSPPGPDRTRST